MSGLALNAVAVDAAVLVGVALNNSSVSAVAAVSIAKNVVEVIADDVSVVGDVYADAVGAVG